MTTSNPGTGDLAATRQADAADAERPNPEGIDPERAELLAALAASRHFLRFAVRDLTDEQARQRTTASELCLGGLIKHVDADLPDDAAVSLCADVSGPERPPFVVMLSATAETERIVAAIRAGAVGWVRKTRDHGLPLARGPRSYTWGNLDAAV